MNKLLVMGAALLVAVASGAETLKLEPGTTVREGIAISQGGVSTIEGKTSQLTTVGSGLRAKKVLISNVKVYVAQLLVSSADKYVKSSDEALNSLSQSETVAMELTFLRNVEAAKVQVSFEDALIANNVNLDEADINAFLTSVKAGGDADEGQSMTIAITKNQDGSETLVYEDTNGQATVVKGSQGLTQKVMSIWLGTPADSGLETLKQQMLE